MFEEVIISLNLSLIHFIRVFIYTPHLRFLFVQVFKFIYTNNMDNTHGVKLSKKISAISQKMCCGGGVLSPTANRETVMCKRNFVKMWAIIEAILETILYFNRTKLQINSFELTILTRLMDGLRNSLSVDWPSLYPSEG